MTAETVGKKHFVNATKEMCSVLKNSNLLKQWNNKKQIQPFEE